MDFFKEYADVQEKNDYSYDYYLHFEGFNRRNDQWTDRSDIETVKI